jgi:hypothetical protein
MWRRRAYLGQGQHIIGAKHIRSSLRRHACSIPDFVLANTGTSLDNLVRPGARPGEAHLLLPIVNVRTASGGAPFHRASEGT